MPWNKKIGLHSIITALNFRKLEFKFNVENLTLYVCSNRKFYKPRHSNRTEADLIFLPIKSYLLDVDNKINSLHKLND